MNCLHTLGGFPGGLVCDRTDPHATGHTFHGISVDDGRHDDHTEDR